jgi:hypothetical protein
MLVDPSGSNATVTGAIRQAAQMTGTNFQYLLATAQVESNLNSNAQAKTSSASGLFQFIEQTWLSVLKEQGPALGYGPYADAITRLPSGRYAVTDTRLYGRIMNLRSDPTANALMAGAFTQDNATKLAGRLGRDATEGELYIAHFLGADGASRLIALAESRPLTAAADVFPGAARANPTIFYDRQGRARGAGEVYGVLVGRYDIARGGAANSVASAETTDKVASTAAAPDPAGTVESYASGLPSASTAGADSGSVFHGLFRTDARREAVAPMVSALWTAPASAGDTAPAKADSERGGTLDLFQDQASDVRALFRGRV